MRTDNEELVRLAYIASELEHIAGLVGKEAYDAPDHLPEFLAERSAEVQKHADALRALAQQGKAWPAIVQHCVATEAVTPDESDPHGTIRRLIDYHVEMDREQGKAGGVAVYEVQERMSSFAPSSCWTETTRETYEGGYFPETLFHRRILYATPPTHIPDAGNMVSANPPEAGVTDDAETLAMKIYAAHLAEYQHTTLGQQVWDRITEDARDHWVNVARRLTAAVAPQPKDAT